MCMQDCNVVHKYACQWLLPYVTLACQVVDPGWLTFQNSVLLIPADMEPVKETVRRTPGRQTIKDFFQQNPVELGSN